ncbi:MAG: hypothetical protein Q4B48_00770 [Syntrophomonadaceae bacterium]|nr:hypothetical protein [Syntrophomonadaceae bacterium]
MNFLLACFAAALMLGYGYYCWQILRARPQNFEKQLMMMLAEWMVARGPASRSALWMLYIVSLFLVAIYFVLVFSVLSNPAILYLSAALVGVEVYHLITTFSHFRRFFGGRTTIVELLNWKLERFCALLYFAHALLVLCCMAFSL